MHDADMLAGLRTGTSTASAEKSDSINELLATCLASLVAVRQNKTILTRQEH